MTVPQAGVQDADQRKFYVMLARRRACSISGDSFDESRSACEDVIDW
jgi:hypothetical protein